MYDVAIVGAGLFGSIAARALSAAGKSVVVIDDARPDRGSAPAGCVIRPEWISSMRGKSFEEGLQLLDELYGVQDIEFELWPIKRKVKCFRVEPNLILGNSNYDKIPAAVDSIEKVESGHNTGHFCVSYVPQTPTRKYGFVVTKHVILACGIWAHELFEGVEVSGRYGWSWRGAPVEKPTIRPWAPYRQVVSFNMNDGRSWRGDGQALVERSATAEKEAQSHNRCFPGTSDGGRHVSTRGARPYVKDLGGKPCFYERRGNVWCVTGGGKNGTISAAWAAQRLVEEIC